MKQNDRWRRVLALVLSTVFCLAVGFFWQPPPGRVRADAGFFSGDSDYGGSSDSYDSYDSYNSYDRYRSGSSGSRPSSVGGFRSTIILAGLIMLFLFLREKKRSSKAAGRSYTGTRPQARPVRSVNLSHLQNKDPHFNLDELKTKVSNLYVFMQQRWQEQKFEPMRPHMTDQLYARFQHQLDQQMASHQQSRIERIAVLAVDLIGTSWNAEQDRLIFQLNTRINVSVIDQRTGAVVSGDPRLERFMTYEWELVRSAGVTTPPPGVKPEAKSCPKCGAPMNLSYSTQCEYCGSVVSGSQYDWVIAEIRGTAQRTGR